MLSFVMKSTVPPGGVYFFKLPFNELILRTFSWQAMETEVQRHYAAANLPVPEDIALQIQDYMCRHLPDSFCTGDDEGKPRIRALTFMGIRSATDQFSRHGNCVATVADAARRAQACTQCPMHDRESCTTCNGLGPWAEHKVGRKLDAASGVNPEWLGACRVDSILLVAKVFGTKFTEQNLTGCPESCWVKQEAAKANAPGNP